MRFDLAPSEFEAFISALDLENELIPNTRGFPSLDNPEWIDTSELTDFAGVSSGVNRYPAVQLTADTSRDDVVTLYIFAVEF